MFNKNALQIVSDRIKELNSLVDELEKRERTKESTIFLNNLSFELEFLNSLLEKN